MHTFAIAADVGGTSVKLGLFGSDSQLMDKWEIPTNTQDNGSHILSDIAAAIRARTAQLGLDLHHAAGMGMGVPGPVDEHSVVNGCVNLGWGKLDLTAELARLLPEVSFFAAANDANTATLGELWQGGGKGYSDAVMLTLGTGVGGGVVHGGKILAGANGAAGEVGHITVEPNETVSCNCGKRGCLEQYASANGIVFLAKRMLSRCDTPSPLRAIPNFSAKDICDLAREGDALCLQILDRCGYYLGLAMGYIACTVDPQVFLIGGGMSRAGDVLFNAIRHHYHNFTFYATADTPIAPATLGNDAGIYGCAAMVFR